ncbi:hypothetical protein MD484_g2165, partial [Candolleomyces efflorescens]
MISKGKAKSSKSSFRWPWSKKSKSHLPVDQQPEEVSAERVDSTEVNAQATSSSAALQPEGPIWMGASSSANSYTFKQAETPPSFFPNANHWVVNGGLQINATQHASGSNLNDLGWERLMQHTAPNALHDSKYRFDPPKCDEDTRVEVTEELMGWIKDRASPQRLLCMTGAAGSGKSALQQTVAEQCSGEGILASTFFFSSTDPTRNAVSPVIPTIAYQLGLNHHIVREVISAAVTKDPLIFERSLKTQMNKLIVDPIEHISRAVPGPELAALPYAILIDGLDECANEQRQAELLTTIDDCLLQNDALPFRVFIASRPEWAIRSALEETGYLHQRAYHVQLSDQYDASGDIRRVLWRRLRDIGRRSGDPGAQSPSWPSEEDIETLVANASGQFIYAATVIKFVSERRSSPVDRLRAVITWTPEDRAQPFAALDLLYSSIVSAAKEAYEAAHPDRDFLLLFSVLRLLTYQGFDVGSMFQQITSLEDNSHRWLISDLRSLVTMPSGYRGLHYYHKSFIDFIGNAYRSKTLFVTESRTVEFVTVSCFRVLGPVMDRNESSPPIRLIVSNLLVLHFGRLSSPSSFLNALFTGNNVEKLKKWKAVERCLEDRSKENDVGFTSEITYQWLNLLSHALLDTNLSQDEEFHQVIKSFRDKWKQESHESQYFGHEHEGSG